MDLRNYLLGKPEAQEDFPFGPEAAVFKIQGKMFALLVERAGVASINLKCDPEQAIGLRDLFPAVTPGYHMNKRHWNTVRDDGSVPAGELQRMVDHSYALVVRGLTRAQRLGLEARHGKDAKSMRLRDGTAADSAACAALFTTAVHQLASSHYNAQQCEAWAPLKPDVTRWQKHLGSLELLLAEDAQRLLGFIGYAHDGHIDLLYCAPRAARSGVASTLYLAAEQRLFAQGVTRLFTEASMLAKPFFHQQGFSVIAQEEVQRGEGVTLLRYRMQKILD